MTERTIEDIRLDVLRLACAHCADPEAALAWARRALPLIEDEATPAPAPALPSLSRAWAGEGGEQSEPGEGPAPDPDTTPTPASEPRSPARVWTPERDACLLRMVAATPPDSRVKWPPILAALNGLAGPPIKVPQNAKVRFYDLRKGKGRGRTHPAPPDPAPIPAAPANPTPPLVIQNWARRHMPGFAFAGGHVSDEQLARINAARARLALAPFALKEIAA